MNSSQFNEKEKLDQELLQAQKQNSRDGTTRSTLANHNPNQNNERPKVKNAKRTFSRLIKYTLRYKGLLFLANVAMVISSLGSIYLPLLCGSIIDDIRQENDLTENSIKFVILTLGMAIFSSLRGYCFNILGEKIVMDMRKQMFNELIDKDITYYDQNKSGQLISRLTSDIAVVQSAASDNISMLLRNILQFLGSLIFLFLISWKLTTLIIVLTPVISCVLLYVIKAMQKLQKQYQNNLAFANSLANQVFGNIRVVRSFSTQQNETKNYSQLLLNTYQTGKRKSLYYAIMLLSMTLFGNLLILSVLYFGGKLTIDGELSIGNLTSYVLYAVTLTVGFASISGIVNQIVSALGVSEKIFQIMDEPVKIVNGNSNPDLISGDVAIEFRNATFAYPSKESVHVLKNINFKVYKGQSVALVGASGSGKSSIVSLILRFYDLIEGELLIGGKNIKQVDIEELRKQVGFVSQEPVLFSGNLRENIEYGLGNGQKSDDKVLRALEVANAKEFALNQENFPQKLDTLVGERGIKLSGGQKQRIAIARCIIKEPNLLIFDEATSALDAESQHLVQKAIDGLVQARQRTMIVVAHRLSTIRNCDRIVVLKNGEIVEQGTHNSLLNEGGIYKNLVEKQLSNFQDYKMKINQE